MRNRVGQNGKTEPPATFNGEILTMQTQEVSLRNKGGPGPISLKDKQRLHGNLPHQLVL